MTLSNKVKTNKIAFMKKRQRVMTILIKVMTKTINLRTNFKIIMTKV